MLLSWSTPVLAQFVMLIIMCMQRHWLYVLMLAPGLLGSALSLAVMAIRSRRARQATSQADTGISNSQTSPDVAWQSSRSSSDLSRIPCIDFEQLHHLDDDPLIWRSIVRRWFETNSSGCDIGMTAHAPFAIDLVHAGPHAMVAGTTGSGKSALLISWCMALSNGTVRRHCISSFLISRADRRSTCWSICPIPSATYAISTYRMPYVP